MNPGRRMLVFLAVLFFAPIAAAFYLYFGHSGLQPSHHVNHGELALPTRQLPLIALPLLDAGRTDSQFLRHKWSFLYLSDGACGGPCRKALYDTRQVRTALDRDMTRVQRVFVATSACCDRQFLRAEHPDLIVVPSDETAQPFIAALPRGSIAAGRIYLVDPLGNLVLSYAAGAPARGMLEDIQRLLKLSHIG